jgi:ADP-ribose pyrophosphatase
MESIEEIKKRYGVVDRKLLYSYTEGYIGKNVYEVTLKDGTKKISEQILKAKGKGDAAVIVPLTEEGKFVIIVESRPNVPGGYAVEFPAGMVDPGEDHKAAAKRELEEETGYVTDDLEELEWHYQDQGCSQAVIKSFLARNCKKVAKQNLDEDETISSIEMTYDEVTELIKNNEIADSGSRLAYMTYTLKKERKI